jgi:hypothetical protein
MRCRRKACDKAKMVETSALYIREGERMWFKPPGGELVEQRIDPDCSALVILGFMDLEQFSVLECPSCGKVSPPRKCRRGKETQAT